MIKPEWGAKRACPKCNTRFYDLGKDDPVTCINCGTQWVPDPVLKSKQPLAFEAAKPTPAGDVVEPAVDALAEDEIDLEADTEAGRADGDVDIGTDDDIDVVAEGDEPEER